VGGDSIWQTRTTLEISESAGRRRVLDGESTLRRNGVWGGGGADSALLENEMVRGDILSSYIRDLNMSGRKKKKKR